MCNASQIMTVSFHLTPNLQWINHFEMLSVMTVLRETVQTFSNFPILHVCVSDIDECNGSVQHCDDNAGCTNIDGSFSCTCIAGYSGDGFSCDGKYSYIKDNEDTIMRNNISMSFRYCWLQLEAITVMLMRIVRTRMVFFNKLNYCFLATLHYLKRSHTKELRCICFQSKFNANI